MRLAAPLLLLMLTLQGAAQAVLAACPLPVGALQPESAPGGAAQVGPGQAGPAQTGRAEAGPVQAAWQVDGTPIAVGHLFAITLQLCPDSAVLTRADAWMPAHGHGMNYRPSVQPLGKGRWRLEGLMFHMPGRWELRLDVQADGKPERLLDTLTLP